MNLRCMLRRSKLSNPAERTDRYGLVCLSLFLICAFTVVRGEAQETAPAQETELEDLVNIDFRADLRLFTVMAALNAAGFDYERPNQDMSPVRQAVRLALKDLEPSLSSRLAAFYQSHRGIEEESRQQIAYTSLALLIADAPAFSLTEEEDTIPNDVLKIQGFAQLVEEFYRIAQIETLWSRFRGSYQAESRAYRPVLEKVIEDILRYFRIGPRRVLNRQMILIPDLLNAKDLVNARNLDRTYYIVVGPTDEPGKNYSSLQHEYLHVLVDPLVEKFAAQLRSRKEILKVARAQPKLKQEFRDSATLVVIESLIESIVLRLHPPSDLSDQMFRLFRQGTVLVPFFYRELVSYEQGRMLSFPTYAEFLLQSAGADSLEDDIKRMDVIEARIQERDRQAAEDQLQARRKVERRNLISSMLSEAGQLISRREFELARQKLGKLLEEDPENGNAYFYLGQIADQLEEPLRSYEHYQRAAESPSNPPWIRAWSLVRMGKFLAFKDQFSQARQRFEEALTYEGELRGARNRAERAIKELPRPE